MTAFYFAAFCAGFALLRDRPAFWALQHLDARVFWIGAVGFFLLGLVQLWFRRLPFRRRQTPARIETMLAREAPLAWLFAARVRWWTLPALGLFAAFLFYLIRMRLFLPPPAGLGDSLLLLEHVPVYTRLFGYLDSFDELLGLYIGSRAYLIFAELWNWPVEQAYAVLSSAAGGLYVLGVLGFLRGRQVAVVISGLALFLGSPAIQLYAGYVENYTLAALALAGCLFYAGRALEAPAQERPPPARSVLILAALAAIGVLLHGVVAFLGPALVYFTWRAADGNITAFTRLGSRATGVAGVIIGPVWVYFFFFAPSPVDFFESFAYRPAILPPGQWFTSAHLLNLGNLVLLAAPGGLALLLLALPGVVRAGRHRPGQVLTRLAPEPVQVFFGVATLGFAAHVFVWNPLIGFPADWDLFTMFQAPLHGFVFYRLIARPGAYGARGRPGPTVIAGLVFITLTTTSAWLYRNAQDSPASTANRARATANAGRFSRLIENDEDFARIRDHRRRKQYVKGLLFVLRSRDALAARPGPEATALGLELERAWLASAIALVGDDSRYAREFPPAWQELTRVNLRLEEFKNRYHEGDLRDPPKL